VKITVTRDAFTDKSTTSTVTLGDALSCFGLEDVDRQLELYPERKVAGETAIPRGTYKVIVDFSQRFQCLMPHILDVPGFDGIRIHPLNEASQTHGCLGVGTTRKDNWISNSRVAYKMVLACITNELDCGNPVEIEFK
jgi:hypothetical protein